MLIASGIQLSYQLTPHPGYRRSGKMSLGFNQYRRELVLVANLLQTRCRWVYLIASGAGHSSNLRTAPAIAGAGISFLVMQSKGHRFVLTVTKRDQVPRGLINCIRCLTCPVSNTSHPGYRRAGDEFIMSDSGITKACFCSLGSRPGAYIFFPFHPGKSLLLYFIQIS